MPGKKPLEKTRIAVVAPSRQLTREACDRLQALTDGPPFADTIELVIDPQCGLAHGHFAGDDHARCAAFVAAANDPTIDAIWLARGGYGAFRLLPDLVQQLGPAARQKSYLGYSDGGALLAALYGAGIGRVAHGPMAADILRAGGEACAVRALSWLISQAMPGEPRGSEPILAFSGRPAAPLAAFNLTVLAALCGTPFMPDLAGHILCVEEVGEYLYRVDRAMGQVMSQPFAPRLAGLYLGRVSDVPENDIDFGMDEEAIARHWCDRAAIPFLGRADIGHDGANKIVPFGAH